VEITVLGRNLERVRQLITEGRARFIQEGRHADPETTPEDAPYIEQIALTERDDEA
jgi:hypothetical protein